jgi:hypothetical protein
MKTRMIIIILMNMRQTSTRHADIMGEVCVCVRSEFKTREGQVEQLLDLLCYTNDARISLKIHQVKEYRKHLK